MRRSHRLHTARSRWGARLAALLAVVLQIFVVQTHVHALTPSPALTHAYAADGIAIGADAGADRLHAQPACTTCQAQSSSRALPLDGALLETGRTTPEHGAVIAVRRMQVAPAHSWQSRAPPAHV